MYQLGTAISMHLPISLTQIDQMVIEGGFRGLSFINEMGLQGVLCQDGRDCGPDMHLAAVHSMNNGAGSCRYVHMV